MNRTDRPTYGGWAIIILSAAVLTLGGCGRKGGLDLPPNASAEATAAAQANADHEPGPTSSSLLNPSPGTDAPPTAPSKGPKRSFVLDPLLQSN